MTSPEEAKRIANNWKTKSIFEAGVYKFQEKIQDYYDMKDLAEKLIEVQPLYYDQSKIWWAWNKKEFRWDMVDETDVLNLVSKSAKANTVRSKEKMEIIEALKQVSRMKKPETVKKTWVQFRDIIVDVETGQEFKSDHRYFITNPIPWKLHDERLILTPKMDEILSEWVGEENIQTLYEILAYCMLPDYPIHRLFCFIGGGMNGKSCFLRLLKKFIGKDNVTSTELDTLLNSRFEVTRLHKKLVCQMGETNFTEMNKTSIIKKLTGQDTIGFEYKNKTPFDEENYAKILIATNNLPTTTDKTVGFYRRWLIIDFPNQFSEKKDILSEIPDEEYEILAVKSLLIIKQLLQERKFHNEGEIEDRIKKYEDKSNPFAKFWNENIIEDGTSDIWKHEFRNRIQSWCKEHRFRELNDTNIGKEMKTRGIDSQQIQADFTNDRGIKPRWRAWRGVKWKE